MIGGFFLMKGFVIKESLKDESLLNEIKIKKTETWKVEDVAKNVPKVWTALTFEALDKNSSKLAEHISNTIHPSFYVNFNTEEEQFIIFANKIFRYPRGDMEMRAQAQDYGSQIGIPKMQLEWNP